MSAKTPSRDFAQGRVKWLRRIRPPLALQLAIQTDRGFVPGRAVAAASGRHVRSQGARRRAETMALARVARSLPWGGEADN